MGKRVLLRRQTATIYAGELNDAAAYYGMDEDPVSYTHLDVYKRQE